MPIPSQASEKSVEGVETGWAAPKDRKVHGEGTVQTTNEAFALGGESRSGMNPGVGGSNPLVDTISSFIIVRENPKSAHFGPFLAVFDLFRSVDVHRWSGASK
jgi:hypothetical protein